MAEISKSVVHLTMRFGSEELAIGTGFVYKKDDRFYIVTAWHNVTGRHPDTFKPNKNVAIPDNVVVNFCFLLGENGMGRMAISLPLYNDERACFYIHPENWPRVNVVAIPFDPYVAHPIAGYTGDGKEINFSIPLFNEVGNGLQTSISPIQDHLVRRGEIVEKWFKSVDVTEELFIPGYPQNVHDMHVQPVWKRATIASSVQMKWNRQKKFLVDSASKSGMSGAPVLYYNPRGSISMHGTTFQLGGEVSILAGVYVGRVGVTNEKDPQIGIVWHSDVIDEIIEGARYEEHPDRLEILLKDFEKVVEEVLVTSSKEGLENINNPDLPSRYYVQREILKKIEGRASPEKVLDTLLDVAKRYTGPFAESE
ncbi:hypothetical protein V8Z74_25250 [Comamonas sp. w2-DMI]|uniref:hypothetical protein n=1 Tax=Comamonas sp. w2-DMI TaxID=3126391 RepID=UPI0032E40BB8